MFTPPRTAALRCFARTYRWPRRGCRSRQCLYYWTSLWPWEAGSRPQEGAATHPEALTTEARGDMTSTSYHNTLRSSIPRREVIYIPQAFTFSWLQGITPHTETLKRKVITSLPSSTSCHKALGHTGGDVWGSTVARRNVFMYIPQSFPPRSCFGHMRSACREMSTSGDVRKRYKYITKSKLSIEDLLYNLTRTYSTGHPLRRKKEDGDEDKIVRKKEGKVDEEPAGTEHKLASDSPGISKPPPPASQPPPRQSPPPPASASPDTSKPPPDTSPPASSPDTTITSDIKPVVESELLPSRVLRYIVRRYSMYLQRFQDSLRNEMPDTFKMFSIFTVGLKEFIIDFKDLVTILIQLSLPGFTLASLSRRELEVYYHMPGEMVRVFPIILLSSLPFGQNVAFPIGYWFPRHLLSHHFWDIQQRHEFGVLSLKRRLFNARPVFRSLQAAILTLNDEDKEKCRNVFFKLGSGIHPNVEEILALIPLFQREPFHIHKIGSTHVNALLRLHGRSALPLRRRRLKDHAHILHCMDAAISREGVDSLTHDNLKNTLIFRGLNPTNMSSVAMLEYLQNWLSVSREVDASSYSLLLHLPIFLAYNQPSNFHLIYS
ncbi:uncharacterized protein LOC126982456 [Eriocheir sinensis]|uniref:uncharacterized protein LOC126982456 n=1 Tax=Eriocheir sinensis TaxID=95602 RepID=UPI0021CAB9AD|nr:uncharacterized protein LOC126982456 [Eriocheir sinensis]